MELCKICDQPASGNHFGVLSCRACAAFFRRGSENLTRYTCKSGKNNCTIFKNDRYQCKKCRLERCLNEGMDDRKFQFNRDLLQTSHNFLSPFSRVKRKLPYSSEDGPTWITLNDTCPGKTYIDLKYLLNQASGMLRKKPGKSAFLSTSSLHRISKAINCSRELPTASNLHKLDKLGRIEKVRDWENAFLLVTHWLTYFDEFQELEESLRMEILMTIWHIWVQIDRLAVNAIGRKRGVCGRRSMIVGYRFRVDFDDVVFDTKWFSNYNKEDIRFFLEKIDWNLLNLIPPMMDLCPTDVELTYMILQLCFNYAGKRLQNDALAACDRFAELLSNDLHKYYVEEQGKERYSTRLAQLMSMNRRIEKDIVEKRWKYDVSRVFDVWKLEFSHPQVFQDNSF